MFNASPNAHNQSAAAALRRPPARHLAALRLFLEAPLFAQSPPNRWISRLDKNIGEDILRRGEGRNWTRCRSRCNPPWKLRYRLFFGFLFSCYFFFSISTVWLRVELNAVCAPLCVFSPNKTGWKSWSKLTRSLDLQWEYNQVSKMKWERIMYCRLKRQTKRKTGWYHINTQGLHAEPHCSFHGWRGWCWIQEV